MSDLVREYMSVLDAIQFTGLSRPTIYRMMSAGLPFHKVGSRTLIRRGDLVDVIEGRKPFADAAA
jgi:excisionase family DNA binding protein